MSKLTLAMGGRSSVLTLRLLAATSALVSACGADSGMLASDSDLHKVQVPAPLADELTHKGAAVLADYESFQLVAVDDEVFAAIADQDGVELRDDYNRILLNAKVIDTTSPEGRALQSTMIEPRGGKRLHLVQFVGPIQEEWYERLEATGVQIVTYIPNNAYLVYGEAAVLEKVPTTQSAKSLQWHGVYLDEYKLDSLLGKVDVERYTIQMVEDPDANANTLAVIVSLAKGEPIVQSVLGYVNVVAPFDVADLSIIAQQPEIVSIKPRFEPELLDERQDMILAGSLTGNAPSGPGYLAWLASKGFTQAQFTASGFGVDVTDSGLDDGTTAPNHFGLYVQGNILGTSRVVYNRLEGTPNPGSTLAGCDGHGNINAHIVGGYADQAAGAPFTDAQGYHFGLGMAPFVRLGSSVVFDPGTFTNPNVTNLQSRAYNNGMRISSNSWGSKDNSYTADSQTYDGLVRDAQPTGSAFATAGNQEMVIVFAAGNAGSAANTVGQPGTAKNVLTVGASEGVQAFGGADACAINDLGADSANDIISFSSRGPTQDGRKKPDIMAPGTHISGGVAQAAGQQASPPAVATGQHLACYDASGVCGGAGSDYHPEAGQEWYTASSGTSHSTPALSGAAALVRQYFINAGRAPASPAMTKAFLMNAAHYMNGVGANDSLYSNNQGMGRLDLGVAFDGTARLLDDQNVANIMGTTGQTRTFTGYVSDRTRPFRATLAWTDAPGTTAASPWKNNLDLTVTIGGNTYRGNVFTGALSTTGGTADSMNNVESVFLAAGLEGAYTVTVTATNINSDGVPGNADTTDQDFALVVYNSCASAPATPTGLSATNNGSNRIDVGWAPNGATDYHVYRSMTSGGPYQLIGTAAAPPYADIGVSGGTTYYYVVRAHDCAESPASAQVSRAATGPCNFLPGFGGLTSATSAYVSTCTINLTWAAATPSCAGAVSYSIYRSTSAGFAPAPANRVASGQTGTTFSDTDGLASGTNYYYIVHAVEVGGTTVEDTNAIERSATVYGVPVTGLNYVDDFDGTRPANADAYWIAQTVSGTTGTMNITTCRYQSATHAYRMGPTGTACNGTPTYPANTSMRLILGGDGSTPGINGFAIPASATTAELSFRLWYNLETNYDYAYLTYSATGAAGPWILVKDVASTTAPYITAGGYDNANDVWTGAVTPANGSLKAVTVNLNNVAGQTVWFAFRVITDDSINREGMYIDDVSVTADAHATCSTPGPAASYVVSGLPANVAAGIATTFTVTAYDAGGIVVTGYNGTAAITSSDPRATLPGNITFTNGVASGIPITFGSLGSQSVTATDIVTSSITASASTTVGPGTPAKLVFSQQPSNTAAGASITPAVRVSILDTYDNLTASTANVTITLAANPGSSTLSGTTTVAAVGGVATFDNLSLNKAALNYQLHAAALTFGVDSGLFNITAANPAKLVFSQQPTNTAAAASITPAVRVSILDANDNLTTSTANVTITLAANPGSSTLSGTTTVAAVGGVATFNNLSLNKAALSYQLHAAALTFGVDSGLFNITAANPAKLVFSQQPTNTAAAASITPAVRVSILDANDNLTTATANVTITLAANPGSSTLSGTTTIAAVAGVATFNNLSLNKAALNYQLHAAALTFGVDSALFNITAANPAKLVFSQQPTNTAAAASITPAVAVSILDANDNLTTSTANVTITLAANPGSSTLSGTATVAAVGGVATFSNLSLNKAALNYRLHAAALTFGVDSTLFNITAANPAKLVFSQQPTNTAAAASITPAVAVSILDANDNLTTSTANVTITLAANPGGSTLSGTTTVAAVGGVATFNNLSLNKAALSYQLHAAALTFGVDSGLFNIIAAGPARLVFSQQPTNTSANSSIAPAVQVSILDGNDNLTTSTANVTITLAANPGGSTLAGTATVAAVGGIATFNNLSLNKAAQNYRLHAAALGFAVDSTLFDITSAVPATLVFSQQPTDTRAGASITPAVHVSILDVNDNLTSSTANVTITLAANPGSSTLSGTTTVAAVGGVATFNNLSLNKVGQSYQLHAAALAFDVDSTLFDITAGDPTKLVFSREPSDTVAAASITPAVQVSLLDANDNVTTSTADVTITLAANPGSSTLSGTTTVAAVGGVATFSNLSLNKAALSYQLHAAALTFGVDSALFDITAGDPAKVVFSGQPSDTVAGASITPAVAVSILDANDNLTTSTASVTLTLAANPGSATLSGTTTIAAVNGVATFNNLSLDKAALSYQLHAAALTLGADSALFDITVGQPAALVFQTPPASTIAGTVFGPILVEIRDALNNLVTDATGPVTVSLGGPVGGTLGGTLTVTPVGGIATFADLFINTANLDYTLTVSMDNVADVTSDAFDVAPGDPAVLVFAVQPAATQAGSAVSPAVQVAIHDAHENVVTAATTPVLVALARNPGSGTLAGTLTATPTAGVATFSDLSINRAALAYALSATADTLPTATSVDFDVTPGPAASLAFVAQPQSTTAGVTLATVQVEVRDGLGNRINGASGPSVTLAFGNNPSSATLLGALDAAAASGLASFADLAVQKVGTGYTLIASSASLQSATSTAFDIGPAAAASFLVSLPPSATLGVETSFDATAFDTFGNRASGYTGSPLVTSSDSAATLPDATAFIAGELIDQPVTFATVGVQSVTLTDNGPPSITGTAQTTVTAYPQPTVAITAPADGAEVSAVVSITASGAVATGLTVTELAIRVDGAVIAVGTDATLTATWDTTSLADGSAHTLTASITDSATNVVVSTPVTVTIASKSDTDGGDTDSGAADGGDVDGGDPSGGDTIGGDDQGGGDEVPGDPAGDSGPGPDTGTPDKGCGCDSDAGAGGGFLGLLLLLGLMLRLTRVRRMGSDQASR